MSWSQIFLFPLVCTCGQVYMPEKIDSLVLRVISYDRTFPMTYKDLGLREVTCLSYVAWGTLMQFSLLCFSVGAIKIPLKVTCLVN